MHYEIKIEVSRKLDNSYYKAEIKAAYWEIRLGEAESLEDIEILRLLLEETQ